MDFGTSRTFEAKSLLHNKKAICVLRELCNSTDSLSPWFSFMNESEPNESNEPTKMNFVLTVHSGSKS